MLGVAVACTLAAVATGPVFAQSAAATPSVPAAATPDSAATADSSSGEAPPLQAPPLQEVLVTARGIEPELPQQLALYGTRVDTVSAAQIKNGGYIDVSQALQATTPGIYISSANGPFNYVDVSLQGSRTEDVLWLVDGIRINNALLHRLGHGYPDRQDRPRGC